MTFLVLFFCLAVFVSFICSLLEAVILSVTYSHIEVMVNHGHRSGLLLRNLKKNIDLPLAAILTVNTVANTVGAAGVGAQALHVFGSQWVALASGILTFCILVFSEIIPKTIGVIFWKRLAPIAAYMIKGLIIITFPFAIGVQALVRLLAGKREGVKITREEMIVSAEMGKDQGELLDRERRIIKNLLRLNVIYAKDVMTPRAVMFALPEKMTVGEVLTNYTTMRFSRIPIFDRDMDDITGLVRRYQINQAYSQGRAEESLKHLANPIHVVPESKSVAATLDEFILRREHIFLVVDEYGGTEGLITLEDAIETLLGVEIVDELDSVDDMRKLAVELWEKRKQDHHF